MSISTLSFNNASRASIQKLQSQLKDASYEVTNERHTDVGASLGRLTGTAVSYRVQETSFDAQLQTNKVITGRLEQSQKIMEAVNATGDSISSSLLSAEKYTDYPEIAKSALQQLQSGLNTPVGGVYLFAGKNSDVAPIKDVDAGIAAAKAKFDDFLSAIGKTASNVTQDEIDGFFGDAGYTVPVGQPRAGEVIKFMDTVDDANWAATWSTASDDTTTARISRSESIQTSISANESGFRKITAAYSMLAGIATSDLNDAARTALTKKAAVILKGGQAEVTGIGAALGNRQNRVEAADTALTQQKDIVNAAFTRLEGVDQTEAGLRVTALETQLQASFTVAGRLQKLSILDYI